MADLHKDKPESDVLKEYAERIFTILAGNMEEVIAVFDTELNYLLANDAACRLLHKTREEIEGKNLLELFPQLTASASHRSLLQALSGEEVRDAHSEGTFTREGAKYLSSYYPLKKNNAVQAVLVVTKKLYYPEEGEKE
jgi:PAS domain S-box-containing protein